MSAVLVYKGCGPWTERLLALRRAVFIEEQRVPEEEEIDALDGEATHFVIEDPGPLPQGTARLRTKAPGLGKAERVAVRADRRGAGVGRALMTALEVEAVAKGHAALLLGAQETAVPFYLRLGYAVEGGPFLDAGIVHYWMRKRL